MRTTCTPEEAIRYIATAYELELGEPPSPEGLAILVAQSALETGHWRSMFGWNAGNIRGSYRGQSQSIEGADEIIDGKRVVVESGFRAYPSAEDGFGDFVRFLMVDTTPDNGRPNKWHRAVDAIHAGDVTAYVLALSDPDGNPQTSDGYFTADPSKYAAAVRSTFTRYLPACRSHLAQTTEPAPAPDTERPPPVDITEHLAVKQSQLEDIAAALANGFLELSARVGKVDSKLDTLIAMVASTNATLSTHDERLAALEPMAPTNGAGHA